MKRFGQVALLTWLCCALLGAAQVAQATDYSFTGFFAYDDDVKLFDFTVGATSPTVTLRTWSYAGGINAQGSYIPRGGFDPILAVFDSTGARIGENDDGGSLVPADAVTGRHYDTYLDLPSLAPGTYTVSVMQYDNFSIGPNLADGFEEVGRPNFTQDYSGGSPGYFYDVTGNQRDSHWEFDILNVEQAVPEPSTFVLLGAGVLGLLAYAWRRRGQAA